MLNQSVIDSMSGLLSLFDLKLIAIISSVFAIYFSYMKISNKVMISYWISSEILKDTHFEKIVVCNKRDKVLIVSGLFVKFGDDCCKLKNFHPPLILKAYEAIEVVPDEYSYLTHRLTGEKYKFTLAGDYEFILELHGGRPITCDVITFRSEIRSTLNVVKARFRDIILTPEMLYIIEYNNGEVWKRTIVSNNGFVFNEFFGDANGIRKEDLHGDNFKKLVRDYCDNLWVDYHVFKITGKELIVQELFTKKSLSNND